MCNMYAIISLVEEIKSSFIHSFIHNSIRNHAYNWYLKDTNQFDSTLTLWWFIYITIKPTTLTLKSKKISAVQKDQALTTSIVREKIRSYNFRYFMNDNVYILAIFSLKQKVDTVFVINNDWTVGCCIIF